MAAVHLAIRLPCGHLFYEDAVKDWLKKSNECLELGLVGPVCRWELPSDDAEHEKGRSERMAGRYQGSIRVKGSRLTFDLDISRFVHVKKTIKSALNTIIEEHARQLEMWANRKNLQLVGAGVMDLAEKTCHDVYSRRYANATSFAKAVA
ncbi:E3 ubiquitin-protein ligase [Symbiodinium microadriaticum]|uniref:E3 ubiquitin-protein ligase n=1 Tax=Symbiodinium microadriaticum TaxID=2951 RepID=A0A1Q9D4A6_SYMMI|nr:E3 ubiquitin-protein ligase [Symbiodinium microadriaticum]